MSTYKKHFFLTKTFKMLEVKQLRIKKSSLIPTNVQNDIFSRKTLRKKMMRKKIFKALTISNTYFDK